MDIRALSEAFYEMYDFISSLPCGEDGLDADYEKAMDVLRKLEQMYE